VQEALTNVVKHAEATHVLIDVVVSDGLLKLTVEDNGIGCNLAEVSRKGEERGWGLVGMAERALAVGGTCRVRSEPGLGTMVIAEVPL
jgi:signal transduction histidine kinase